MFKKIYSKHVQSNPAHNKGSAIAIIGIINIIAAVIFVALAHQYVVNLERERFDLTKHRLAVIQDALLNHMAHRHIGHGDFPCAAPIDLVEGDPGFGKESDTCVKGGPSCGTLVWADQDDRIVSLPGNSDIRYAANTGTAPLGLPNFPAFGLTRKAHAFGALPPKVISPPLGDPAPFECAVAPPVICTDPDNNTCTWTGAVPTRTLNLPDDYMYDGWGNRFTYTIVSGFAQKDQMELDPAPTGQITILDENGNVLKSDASMVVFSHGPDEKGGLSTEAIANVSNACQVFNIAGAPGPARDNENCDGDRTFIDENLEFISARQQDEGDLMIWR